MKVTRRREAMVQAVLSGMTEVAALCDHFGISEVTVRRDLRALADDGLILRTYGGAASVSTHAPEESLEQRSHSFQAEKDAIGAAAAAHVAPGDTVFLDAGTTTAALAKALASRQDIKVITNNLLVVQTLAGSHVAVTMIGGDVRESSMSTFGPIAQLGLSRFTFDKAFLGADGVVPGRGLCEATVEQAYLKECIIRQAAKVFVLVTADKLNRDSQQHWTPVEKPWTLVTDAMPGHAGLHAFENLPGVKTESVDLALRSH
ncbi:DeoR/GlpR family DNA-binding transcription regulator [Herbaspirillum robiniae]|uniref:DeoR family transcriptional regulator n=1 Tax=Herbaspirillum robiniae TaxID=2014887 RepID=A0A246WSG5_9BURK|nr:DeoR/GlpR family DNA-binding transcription regulator [Herbaspirillum robiniae]NUU03617.1 DeoR/GlpR transcriptional regulator [Herbaspirillum robiniae]OWY28583.1 DeoR family transcriptional regulator [Herbaspirillum robiniae]